MKGFISFGKESTIPLNASNYRGIPMQDDLMASLEPGDKAFWQLISGSGV